MAILTSIHDDKSAERFARRIIETIEEPFAISNHLINISISIGIASCDSSDKHIEKTIEKADKAMYSAKQSGCGVVIYKKSTVTEE